jgi:F420-dependent oxidoreductase-like protein
MTSATLPFSLSIGSFSFNVFYEQQAHLLARGVHALGASDDRDAALSNRQAGQGDLLWDWARWPQMKKRMTCYDIIPKLLRQKVVAGDAAKRPRRPARDLAVTRARGRLHERRPPGRHGRRKAMKIAMSIGAGGSNTRIPIERIRRAEELGFHSVWCAETYGADAMTPLAYIAALTSKIKLGTGIAQLAARPPANLAMCAQTVDALAGGNRMILGIGMSGPQIVEGWYGQPWGRPNIRMRDYVSIIRKIFRREGPVAHDGTEIGLPYHGPGSSGLGKPLKMILHTNPDIPIVLGTATPMNIRMTAEIADGWMGMHLGPHGLRECLPLLEEGIAKRSDGMTLEKFEKRASVRIHIENDVRAAIDALKPQIALYAGGMGARDKNFHADAMRRRGYGATADRIQELFLSGRKDEAAAAVPDEYVDDEALIGPPERIRQRWRLWLDSGLSMVSINDPSDEELELMGSVREG